LFDCNFSVTFALEMVFSGYFHHGFLNGIAEVILQDTRTLTGLFKHGILHGPVIIKGTAPILPVSHLNSLYEMLFQFFSILDQEEESI